ncbi:replication protein [Ewingella americana]
MNLAYDENVIPIRPPLEVVEQRVADTDDGFTRLANELYEELIGANLTRNQAKVAHAVCRKTYGFNKKMDRIADSQIALLTRLPRQKVNKAKNELLIMKVLLREGQLIGPNKALSEWQIPDCHLNNVSVTTVVTKNVTKTVTALSLKQGHTKDTITKDKKDIKNLTSENSRESSNEKTEKFLAKHPEAIGGVYTPSGQQWGTADDLKAVQWIYSAVLTVSPTAKEPRWADWANIIRLMRVQDNRTHKEICSLFKWANKDTFWSVNILSPAKLREKWNDLSARANRPTQPAAQDSANTPHWNSRESWKDFI